MRSLSAPTLNAVQKKERYDRSSGEAIRASHQTSCRAFCTKILEWACFNAHG